MNKLRISGFILKCLPFIYLTFFFSIFIGFRAITSLCEAGLFLITILLASFSKERIIKKSSSNYFVIGCLLLYFLQIAAMAYTNDFSRGWRQIEMKLTLILIPITFYCNNYLSSSFRIKIMPFYVLLLASTLLFCLGFASFDYSLNHDSSVFFYHTLVEQFDQHAVLFSILTFIGFVFLLEGIRKHSYVLNKPFHLFLIVYFIFFIILLSSKIVIIFSFISVVLYISYSINHSGYLKSSLMLSILVGISILVALMATHNPVSSRFKDIFKSKINVTENKPFNPGDYFNGLQFRLLEWKLVAEILNENKAWVFGVSPGDAQQLLDKKYLSLNMYVGDNDVDRHGFLGYNTHNEFLESVLQTGIVGLLVFLMICAGCIQMMLFSRNTEFWLIGSLILSYCLVESVLETQNGLLIFTFFPLFLFYTTAKESIGESLISPSYIRPSRHNDRN